MRWQPTPQECALIVDMLAANRPKAAIAKFLYISDGRLRRWLARLDNERHHEERARRHAAE
jgi:DNA invertase Pin-like site-specific DNA recombinase